MLSMTATTVMTTTMALLLLLLLLILTYFSIYRYGEKHLYDGKSSWPYLIFSIVPMLVPMLVSYNWYFTDCHGLLRTMFQYEFYDYKFYKTKTF